MTFTKLPGGTVMFQPQAPMPGFDGYPGVEKLLPSPVMYTVELLLRLHVPDETESINNITNSG